MPDAVAKTQISATVTFKVVNGAWNDETTTDKTVTLSGYEGDTLKLAADQIPAVGNKPNDGYQVGSWDVTPSTETAITRTTTYTYTYSAREVVREAATVTRTPSANNLTFNEQAQELVTAGEASGGTINYVLGENATTAPASGWDTTIPTGTNAGTYFVWFMAKGDADHNDSQASCVTVTINEASETPDTPETPAVTITTGNFTLVPNGTRQLEVTVVPQGSAVTYSSSNPAVATIDQNGRVTAVAEGRAVITAKITVDGTDYTSTCTVAVTGNAQPTRSDEIPAHVHSYVWDTREATESEDGEYRYQCSVCGDIQTRVPITAYYTFNKNTAEKIRKAKQGETVKIETARWISFHKMVADAMKDRPDVTLNISFLDQGHKGVPYTMTIPAGTDMESLLDEHGFAGFLYLGGKYGMTAR